MKTRTLLVTVATTLALLLTACSGDDAAPDDPRGFNDADVAFATDMIQHHAQALAMVDTTLGRDLSPETAELMEEIRQAQAPEIEQMTDLLEAWEKPVPETSRDHANAHDDSTDSHDADMPGMMSAEQMDELERTKGPDFEPMLLDMMVEHHEGAVEMAQTELDEGAHAKAQRLARDIVQGQTREIERMRGMLG